MAVMELKDLHDEMQTAWSEMQHVLTEQDSEIKKQGDAAGETKATVERLNSRLDEIEVKMQRAAKLAIAGGADAVSAERKAFTDALRYGLVGLRHQDADAAKLVKLAKPGDLEGKALSLGDDTAGGFDRILSAF